MYTNDTDLHIYIHTYKILFFVNKKKNTFERNEI